jgi:putative ATPase
MMNYFYHRYFLPTLNLKPRSTQFLQYYQMVKIMTSPTKPLAERMRPTKPEDFVGQPKIWSSESLLRKLVEKDELYAALFWGPPGTGKTTLAGIIGFSSGRELAWLSAVSTSVKEMREAIQLSANRVEHGGKASILFIDEIHRLNKNQQDVLLPAIESGIVRFIGATTENPSFSVNNSVLSRSLVFVFQSLTPEEIEKSLHTALQRISSEAEPFQVAEGVLKKISDAANGDLRRGFNLLQAAIALADPYNGTRLISDHVLSELQATFSLRYDKQGESHYDLISAMIKSVRASHPDAALYYMARMLESGEDPLFIARRLLILASEDIGNANPAALSMAQSMHYAVDVLGMPEARIPLAQCLTYLACSPKSNRAYVAIGEALEDVRKLGDLEPPLHLRNAPTKLMKNLGYGKGYAYAHDDPRGAAALTYLPSEIAGRRYYEPSEQGAERQLKENLKQLRPKGD